MANTSLSLVEARRLNLNQLATDLVLFGSDDMDGVLRAHKIDEIALEELLTSNKAFIEKVKETTKRVSSDPMAIVRLKASSAVETHIPSLNEMAADIGLDARDRREAIRLLAELADALPKQSKQNGTGVVLQFNLGNPVPVTVKPVNVIEHGEFDE